MIIPGFDRAACGLCCIVATLFPLAVAADWTQRAPLPGDRPGMRCILQTGPIDVFDGYQTTQAHVEVSPTKVTVRTTAVLDPGFNDVGLTVGNRPMVPADRYDGQRAVIFEKDYAGIVEQFKLGREVRFALRFWPTWPATGTHDGVFSLMGFSAAYEELRKCRPE